jgi:hypothetical protein
MVSPPSPKLLKKRFRGVVLFILRELWAGAEYLMLDARCGGFADNTQKAWLGLLTGYWQLDMDIGMALYSVLDT